MENEESKAVLELVALMDEESRKALFAGIKAGWCLECGCEHEDCSCADVGRVG